MRATCGANRLAKPELPTPTCRIWRPSKSMFSRASSMRAWSTVVSSRVWSTQMGMSVARPGWSSLPHTSRTSSNLLFTSSRLACQKKAVVNVARAVQPFEGDPAEVCGEHGADRRERKQPVELGVSGLASVKDLGGAGSHERAQIFFVHYREPGVRNRVAVGGRGRVGRTAPVAAKELGFGRPDTLEVGLGHVVEDGQRAPWAKGLPQVGHGALEIA